MKTPIADFLKSYEASGCSRLHMPGHKGMLGYAHDITEIEGADVLYTADGIIKESEETAAELFGTASTVYSTEGSSLSIKAMLTLVSWYAKERGERPLILAARNVHRAFISAAALVDFDVAWIGSGELITSRVTEDELRAAIAAMEKKPTAVYVTSPDYLGCVTDVKALSGVCHDEGILLLVDNAHGAYMKFLPEDKHPISLGADICCDSAHKTLPTLTGGGYLHISKNAPKMFKERANAAMALFASTSPSYLILESLDLTNAYLEDAIKNDLSELITRIRAIKERLALCGFRLFGDEELKITLGTKDYGYTGRDFARILERSGFVCEFSDDDFFSVMINQFIPKEELWRFADCVMSVERKEPIKTKAPRLQSGERVISIREALLGASEEISVYDAEGRLLSDAAVSCPPAIPIMIPGERISKNAIELFSYYGTQSVRVVKDR